MPLEKFHMPPIEYKHSGIWYPIPEWATKLAKLGAGLRHATINLEEQLVVALALPVHDWAAPFLTLGYLLAAHQQQGGQTPVDRHFQRLMNAPCDTPVKLLHNGLHYDALIAEKKKESLMILFAKKENMTGRVKSRKTLLECTTMNCHEVRFMEEKQFDGVRDRGRKVSDSPDFVSALLHGGDLVTHCVGSRVEYIIVGDLGRLREEAETSFRCGDAEGLLQDMLRIDRFSRPTQDFCGHLLPSASRPQKRDEDPDTGVLVFESATAWLRHGGSMHASAKVILLDRSERNFAQVATSIATSYASRISTPPPPLAVGIAAGIESILFMERRPA